MKGVGCQVSTLRVVAVVLGCKSVRFCDGSWRDRDPEGVVSAWTMLSISVVIAIDGRYIFAFGA